MAEKLDICMICEKRYASLEEAEACEARHDAEDRQLTENLRELVRARTCAFCGDHHDPCRCATTIPEPPKPLAPEAILRLGALTLAAEHSDAVEDLVSQQQEIYAGSTREALLDALAARDRLLANQGRQITDGRSAGRLLREFMRAALYTAGGRPQIEAAEAAIRRLGGEEADARQLKLHGSTLGPLEAPETVAEDLASGERKVR